MSSKRNALAVCLLTTLLGVGCNESGERHSGAKAAGANADGDAVDDQSRSGEESTAEGPGSPAEQVVPSKLYMPPEVGTTNSDPLASARLCTALAEDRAQQNLLAVNRLGLELSNVRAEGRVGAPVAGEYGFFAPFKLEKVWTGPSFLEGETTLINLDEAEIAGLELPGKYIVGFGTTVEAFLTNPYPLRNIGGARSSWGKEVIIPSSERESFTDLLEYSVPAKPLVALVQVAAQDTERSRLNVMETLAGDLPDVVTVSWSTSVFAADFPSVGEQLYLATFRKVYPQEGSGLNFGELMDFRPYDSNVRALAERALAALPQERDVQGLLQAARAYRTGWVFHRAPLVAATQISGMAAECCTSAGGTYFAHDIISDLRGGTGVDRVILGGHDYFSEEQCGDRFLFALDGLDRAEPAQPPSAFICDPAGRWPAISTRPVLPRVEARLPDSEADRAQVHAWLSSPKPRYLLRRETDTGAPFALGPDAVWSQPMAVEQALMTAPLAWIQLLGVANASAHRIAIETTFSSAPSEGAVRQHFELDTECADPRLARAGAWLAPIVVDSSVEARYSGTEANAFLIPGVVLPNYGYIWRIATKFRTWLGADEVLSPAQ